MATAMDFQPLFTDQARQCSLGAVLRWCDSAQGALFSSVPDPAKRQDLVAAWERSFVTRVNSVELLLLGPAWEEALSAKHAARVQVSISIGRVGRTSVGVSCEISTSQHVPLARVNSVMVSVDKETASKPVPLPHPEALRELARESPTVEVPAVCARPAGAFLWRHEVRRSDCDLFGHVNNAVYGDLLEDARRAAAASPGALPAGALEAAAGGDARLASVDYLGQAKPGDVLEVAVWWDPAVQAVGTELVANGEVCARGTIVPQALRANL